METSTIFSEMTKALNSMKPLFNGILFDKKDLIEAVPSLPLHNFIFWKYFRDELLIIENKKFRFKNNEPVHYQTIVYIFEKFRKKQRENSQKFYKNRKELEKETVVNSEETFKEEFSKNCDPGYPKVLLNDEVSLDVEEEKKIQVAIDFLKNHGYKIYKPKTTYEMV